MLSLGDTLQNPHLARSSEATSPSDMAIPKIIHFTIPQSPSESQLKNIDVARKLHPDWRVEVWQDPIDRAEFQLSKYWDKVNSGAQLADLVRLEVVLRHGGFYLDSDITLQRNLDPLRTYPFVIATEDGYALTNAFFGAAPNSPVLRQLIDTLDSSQINWSLAANITTGPRFFARELKWTEGVTVIPRETFYPYHWYQRRKTMRTWTYGAHQWTHSWGTTTGSDRPLRALVRRLHWHRKNLRQRVLTGIRSLALCLRHLVRIHQPFPYSAGGVICAQTVHGPKIYLFGEDGSVTPEIALHGTYEFREELFIKRVVRGGDWVIDVGANVGIFSLLAGQSVGPFGRVFSYEPNPLPAGLLKKSLLMNWLHDRVALRQKAIGSAIGTSQLRFSATRLGDATFAPAAATGTFNKSAQLFDAEEAVDVQVATLDSDFPVDLPIRLLKIDVEGFEHHVLRGAKRLLERQCVDILMLECLQELFGEDWGQFVHELKKIVDYGYEPFTLSWSGKLRETNLDKILFADRGRNIVLVAKQAKGTIPEL